MARKHLYPSSDEPSYYSVPVAVDQIIKNGEDLKLGKNILTAHIAHGHSPGVQAGKAMP
jgi:hypothetical protein